jgi:hypothetical protein
MRERYATNENKVIYSERKTKSMIHSPKFCESVLVG